MQKFYRVRRRARYLALHISIEAEQLIPRFLHHPALASALSNFRDTYPRQKRAAIIGFAMREDVRDYLRRRSPSSPSGSSFALPCMLHLHAPLRI